MPVRYSSALFLSGAHAHVPPYELAMFYGQLEKGATSTHAGTEKQPVSRAKCRGLAKDFANTSRLTNQAPTMSIRKSPLGTIKQLNLLLTVVHLMPILEISACASMHHWDGDGLIFGWPVASVPCRCMQVTPFTAPGEHPGEHGTCNVFLYGARHDNPELIWLLPAVVGISVSFFIREIYVTCYMLPNYQFWKNTSFFSVKITKKSCLYIMDTSMCM
jgi:hypothetical protein